MSIRLICVILLVLAASCEDRVIRPHAEYEAPLGDYSKIEQVETRLRSIARHWKLEVFEKDRDQMAFVTEGKPAFFVALYFDGDAILIVTNVGVGSKIILAATDHGEMPLGDLERLTQDVLKELGTLDLAFSRVQESQGPS